jgi:hypothetical protein
MISIVGVVLVDAQDHGGVPLIGTRRMLSGWGLSGRGMMCRRRTQTELCSACLPFQARNMEFFAP